MKKEIKEALIEAGESIAMYETGCICENMSKEENTVNWITEPEARMINPGRLFWWGLNTMDSNYESDECRNARLLGIAFMITMPRDIVRHKCVKGKLASKKK